MLNYQRVSACSCTMQSTYVRDAKQMPTQLTIEALLNGLEGTCKPSHIFGIPGYPHLMLGRHGHSPPQTKRMFWCDKSKTPGIKLSRQEVGITCHCLWDNQHCMYRVNTVYRNAWKPGFVQFINNKLETNNEYLNMSKHVKTQEHLPSLKTRCFLLGGCAASGSY